MAGMSLRDAIGLRGWIAMMACTAALAGPGSAGAYSDAHGEQVAWVKRAALRFVSAELARNGAGACAVLEGSLRATLKHRTCAQRWSTRLVALLHEPGARARLRGQARAIPSARVSIHGTSATIALPSPLMNGVSRLRWTENCWMLEG